MMTPETMFHCLPLKCTMMAKRCVQRQDARARIADEPLYPSCTAACHQGAGIRAQLPDYAPPKPRRVPTWIQTIRGLRDEQDKPPPKPGTPCAVCGKPVKTKKREHCSVQCAGIGKRKHSAEELTGRKCENCGVALKVYVNTLGYVDTTISMRRRFCSRSCGGKFHGARNGAQGRHVGGADSTPLFPRTPISP